jgi:hypothetical protein
MDGLTQSRSTASIRLSLTAGLQEQSYPAWPAHTTCTPTAGFLFTGATACYPAG